MDFQIQINVTKMTLVPISTERSKLISDDSLIFFEWICNSIICQAIDVFGTVTNIINIICFIKQGFKDPINVTLFGVLGNIYANMIPGLAISDLGCLVTMIVFNICMTPVVQQAELPFDVDDMLYLGGGFPHSTFSRVTSFLTAFITLERCLCIAMPLKVKRIFTSQRVAFIVVSFFVLLLVSVAPIYCVNRFGMVFRAARNKTIYGRIHTEGRFDVMKVSLAVNNVVIPTGAFLIVIVCTTILMVNLHKKSKWRQSASNANSDRLISRDQKVSKMILIISSVFIICFIPSSVGCLVMTLEPEIEMYGLYRNTCLVIFGFSFTLESANSSVNIFIYYNMSSKFRASFRELFGLENEVKESQQLRKGVSRKCLT